MITYIVLLRLAVISNNKYILIIDVLVAHKYLKGRIRI